MLHLMPYDENVLHKLGYARFMQADPDGAKAYYQKLLRINPHDTVAKYYLNQCKHADGSVKRASAKWIIPYQVPFGEAFRRLNHVNRMLTLPHEELYRLWTEDSAFRDQIDWSITLSDVRVKKSMLSWCSHLQTTIPCVSCGTFCYARISRTSSSARYSVC